jgi:hypothetical protein
VYWAGTHAQRFAALQDMLDGDGGDAHVGLSEAGDLDEYLRDLDAAPANGNGADARAYDDDLDQYLGELNLSDDDKEASDAANTPSPGGKPEQKEAT